VEIASALTRESTQCVRYDLAVKVMIRKVVGLGFDLLAEMTPLNSADSQQMI